MMAYRLAAEAAERIAAIAPVGGEMQVATFAPSRPVPVLHVHSVDDPRALYAGGLGPGNPLTGQRIEHRAVEAGLARWRTRDGCTGEGRETDARCGGHRAVPTSRVRGQRRRAWKAAGARWPAAARRYPRIMGSAPT
jgi:poly(3-hydroxybutyrate) depolymerase